MSTQPTAGNTALATQPNVQQAIPFLMVSNMEVSLRFYVEGLGFVGNNMWVAILTDPDGYKLDFESPTDVPEETVYSADMELSTPAQK